LMGSGNSLTPRRNFQLGTGVAKWHNIREISIGRNHRIKQPIIAYVRTNRSGLQARRKKIGLLRGAWSCKLYTTTKRSPRRKITSTQFTQFFHEHTHRIGTLSKVLGRPRERERFTYEVDTGHIVSRKQSPEYDQLHQCSARTHAQSLLKESSIPQLPSSSLSTHSNPKNNSAINSSSPEPLQQQQQQQLQQQAACMISSRWGVSSWHFSSLTAGSASTASVATLDNTKKFYIPIRKVVTSKVFCIFHVVTEGCL
jgi:hypothetical protein